MSEEIIKTRTGGLGSSDAKMVAKIGRNGSVSESDKKRLAIMLGLDEQKQFKTTSMEFGNYIEQCVFDTLIKEYPAAISNPYTKSDKLSNQYGFDIFNHIDFEVENDTQLAWFECKATNENLKNTYDTYIDQLSWHTFLGCEKAVKLQKNFALYIVHYQTFDKESSFIASNLEIKKVCEYGYKIAEFTDLTSRFEKGLQIISNEIKDFKYVKSEELSSDCLPEKIQNQLYEIAMCLQQIKDAESKVSKFNETMLELMQLNNVRTIDNDYFKLTVIPESISTTFDSKKFQLENSDVIEKYAKKSKRKSYIKTTLKN